MKRAQLMLRSLQAGLAINSRVSHVQGSPFGGRKTLLALPASIPDERPVASGFPNRAIRRREAYQASSATVSRHSSGNVCLPVLHVCYAARSGLL